MPPLPDGERRGRHPLLGVRRAHRPRRRGGGQPRRPPHAPRPALRPPRTRHAGLGVAPPGPDGLGDGPSRRGRPPGCPGRRPAPRPGRAPGLPAPPAPDFDVEMRRGRRRGPPGPRAGLAPPGRLGGGRRPARRACSPPCSSRSSGPRWARVAPRSSATSPCPPSSSWPSSPSPTSGWGSRSPAPPRACSLAGLRVVGPDGRRPSPGRAAARGALGPPLRRARSALGLLLALVHRKWKRRARPRRRDLGGPGRPDGGTDAMSEALLARLVADGAIVPRGRRARRGAAGPDRGRGGQRPPRAAPRARRRASRRSWPGSAGCRRRPTPPSPPPIPRARRVFPAKVAERHAIAPFALDGRELSVVTTYPPDTGLLEELGFLLSLHLRAHVAPEWRVRALVQQLYGTPAPGAAGRAGGRRPRRRRRRGP